MNWFLIPARPENIDRSIRNPVALADLRGFLGEKESERIASLAGGEIRCWAMTDGGRSQFEKMAPGDYVLISERGTKKFNYLAEVTDKITNEDLGNHIWPVKPRKTAGASEGKTWKFIYFLKSLRSIDASKSMLLSLLGFDEDDVVAGSRQLDNKKLSRFEAEKGPLLEWLRTNAKLDAPPMPVITSAQPEPPVALLPEPTIGIQYVPAKTAPTHDVRELVFTYNAEKVERGNQGHVDTQNALAEFLRDRGVVPRSPATGEPDFDLAWVVGETVFIAEVKSTTEENEEHQLRLGLGQVLRYRQQIVASGNRVIAVLVPEKEPHKEWLELCETLEIHIGWPGAFERVLQPTTEVVLVPG